MRGPLVGLLCLFCPTSTFAAISSTYPLSLAAAAELLEIKPPLSRPAVRAAYRKKAATSHPDVSKREDAAAHFLRITTAYETLLQFSLITPTPAQESTAPPADFERREPPEADLFARRVAAWREYWQASVQVQQLATEVQRKAAHQAVLAGELQLLRKQLAKLLRQVGPSGGMRAQLVNECRARYAKCAAQHADVSCSVSTLQARVRMLQEEATLLQERAQRVTDGYAA